MSAVAPEAIVRPEPAPLAGLLFGVPLLAMGAFIGGIGLGWVECDPASLRAPRWLICACGAVFAAGGAGVLATALGYGRRATPAIAAFALAGLLVVCHWIAFADGERQFTSTQYGAGLEVQRNAVDERTGRTAFAFAAVSVDVLLVLVALRAGRSAWRARRRPAGD